MIPFLSQIPSPPQAISDWSRIIAGLGSVILTALLVILYKGQQKQLAARHESVLEVTDVEWYDDRAIVWVSNFGNGVAKNLFFTTLVKSDTGEHRNYATRSTALTRIDKDGDWTNLIQPGEEDIPFYAKSKVGQIAPINYSSDWMSLSFSGFVRRAKNNGATEVKFCHVVEGVELSGNGCWARVDPMDQSTNPQEFSTSHSLGNLSTVTKHGGNTIFYPYFRESLVRQWVVRVYVFILRNLTKIIPKVTVRPRVLDASGTKRIKRILLKRQLKYNIKVIKEKLYWFDFVFDYAFLCAIFTLAVH